MNKGLWIRKSEFPQYTYETQMISMFFLTGMHKPSQQTMCQICSSGFYQIHWGQENCDLCPENHYCPVSDYFL